MTEREKKKEDEKMAAAPKPEVMGGVVCAHQAETYSRRCYRFAVTWIGFSQSEGMTSYVKSFAGFTNPDHEIHVSKIDDLGGTEIATVDAKVAKNEKKRVGLSQPDWGKDSYMYLFDRHIARRAYTVPNVEGTFEGLCDKYVSLSVYISIIFVQ